MTAGYIRCPSLQLLIMYYKTITTVGKSDIACIDPGSDCSNTKHFGYRGLGIEI